MHLLYFIERRQTAPKREAEIASLGLAHAFDKDATAVGRACDTGPGGHAGVTVTRSPGERLGYQPEQQTWLKMPRSIPAAGGDPVPAVWVGFWKDSPPTAAELQRPDLLRGHAIRFRDGNYYQCPTALACGEGDVPTFTTSLPGTLTIDADGEWSSGGIEPKYQTLWEIATAFFDQIIAGTPDEANEIRFAGGPLFDHAQKVLAYNYRVTRAEIALLGLFDDQGYVAGEILNALVDTPTYKKWLKKKATETSAGSSTSAGGED